MYETREMCASMCDVHTVVVVIIIVASVSVSRISCYITVVCKRSTFLYVLYMLVIAAGLLVPFLFFFCSLANGVVMICDGVKNKFPWTTILFSIYAFYFAPSLSLALRSFFFCSFHSFSGYTHRYS